MDKKQLSQDLTEIKRDILKDRKETIRVGDEALALIEELVSNPTKRNARKLYNRLCVLGVDEDLAEYVYNEIAGKFIG